MLFRSTWTNQPPQLVDIDRGHPLGKDVAFACLPTGSAPSLAGSVALGNGPRGKHWLFPNATSTTATVNFGAAAAVDVLSQSPGWAMVVFNPGDSAQWSGSANFIANKSDANVTTGWTLYHSSVGVVTLKFVNLSTNKSVVTTSGAITSQKWCVLIYDHGGSTTAADGSRIFVDGVDRTSSSGTGSGAHPTDAALPLQLGLGPYGAVNSSVGQFALAAFGRKRLSAPEIAALTANPWQIFAPTSRKIWVPAIAGGGGAALAASASATPSSTASLTTQITASASATATPGSTAALTTTVALQASSAASTSSSAALTTGISLQAGLAAVATETSTLTTSISLAATPAAVATITPSLSTGIALQAAPTATASLTANLSTAIQLTSTQQAVATLGASFSGSAAALAANLTAVASTSQNLTTGIVLASNLQATATETANLSTGIKLASDLNALATFSPSLTVGVKFTAGLQATSTLSASLSTGISLSSALVSVSNLTNSLSTAIRLASSPAAVATLSQSLTTAVLVRADLQAQATLSGTLTNVALFTSPGHRIWRIDPQPVFWHMDSFDKAWSLGALE